MQTTELKPFNPDLRVGDCTNANRAARASYILREYKAQLEESGPACEQTVQDLITDILHYAHREGWELNDENLIDIANTAYLDFVHETNDTP